MALSQIQCLNEQQVNLRVTESRPEFVYSEEQRLALETLLDEGPSCFQDFIKTNRVRAFLSDLELARLCASVEPYCPVSPEDSDRGDGDGAGTRVSLQYWPARSERAPPRLELGWPQRATYRGATRVAVHAQPPLPGDPHVKEIIRRSIAQAHKVIAVVMDLFTDVDIFKDLLHVSFKRNVAVYIILEVTGVPYFLKMCESAAMHTGHLKNLRVQSIRGTGFFTHSSKKVCGSQSQKFMVVDGDKAVSGSYSFTWTASRLDRSIITVLTGQAVDVFDQLFQDLYMMSDAVNLNTIHLDKEQKLEPIPTKAAPVVQLSATMALKLINPKYALVSGNAATRRNHADPETCTSKSNGTKRTKDMPDSPHVHPGLVHLGKANMIDYLPVWPEPEPPSDVIGFINIRDGNKPLQPHLTRSELFEVSRAIRFKDPPHMPCESLSETVCPRSTSPAASYYEKPLMQHQISPEESNNQLSQKEPQSSSPEEQGVRLPPISNPKAAHSNEKDNKDSSVDHGMGKQSDLLSEQREDTDVNNILASAFAEPSKESQISGDHHNAPFPSPGSNTVENIAKTISNKDNRDNHWNTQELRESGTNETDCTDCAIQNEQRILSDSSSSFSSEEYFECNEGGNGDSELMVMDNGMSAVSGYADEPKTGAKPLSSLMSGLCETASSCEVRKDTEESRLRSAPPEEWDDQQATDVTADKTPDLKLTSANGRNGSSESVSIGSKEQTQETDSTLQHGPESQLIHQVKIDAQERESIWISVVDHRFNMQHVETNNSAESQLRINRWPYGPVRKVAEKQCIVFSDPGGKVLRLGLNPETFTRFYKPNLKSEREVKDDTQSKLWVKRASLNGGVQTGPSTENSHKEDSRLAFCTKLMVARRSKVEQDKDSDNSTLELNESAADEIADKGEQLKPKTSTGCRVGQLSADTDPSKRKTLEYRRVQPENKNKPGVKNKFGRNAMKPVLPQPSTQVTVGPTEASVTNLLEFEMIHLEDSRAKTWPLMIFE
ncbi:uncharacterized protein fam83ga [Clarias gariepinus]